MFLKSCYGCFVTFTFLDGVYFSRAAVVDLSDLLGF